MNDDERTQYECQDCCSAWSGPWFSGVMMSKIDQHEEQTGHRVREVEES